MLPITTPISAGRIWRGRKDEEPPPPLLLMLPQEEDGAIAEGGGVKRWEEGSF